MTTVFVNANFISLNDEEDIYSVMVVNGKNIAYLGFNTPVCYDDAKIVDLNGGWVIPLINDMVYYDITHAKCRVLREGERADFIVLDRNVLKEDKPLISEVYIKGRKKV